jgi:hypothetical protein
MLRILSLMLVVTTITADFRNLAADDKKASKAKVEATKASATSAKVEATKASATSAKAKTDVSPLVPMSDYSKDIRALSCWECFEADGVMCHQDSHKFPGGAVDSSSKADGVCAKPGKFS